MDLSNYKGNLTINRFIEVHGDYYEQRQSEKQAIPAVFQSEEAQMLLVKAQQAGLLDENLQPCTPKSEASLLAFAIAQRLKLEPQWPPFETLWNCKNLHVDYNKTLETHKAGEIMRKIDKILA